MRFEGKERMPGPLAAGDWAEDERVEGMPLSAEGEIVALSVRARIHGAVVLTTARR